MSAWPGALSMLKKLRSCAYALMSDRRGIAAVEFAFVVPLLLSLYFVTMEVSQAIETNKKVSRAGSMVADLITQQQTIKAAEVDAVMKIAESILQPYNRSTGKIFITAIQVTDEASPRVLVVWSRKYIKGSATPDLAKDTVTTVPDALRTKGAFLIRVVSELDYKPMITWAAEDKPVLGLAAAIDPVTMDEVYYLRPRMSQAIPCDDCQT
ncbi:hypothetical protein ASC75_14305 [Aminobacter sp. DSM 101952]|nr:hypothetical protein ASC75_14305 [Aminobacter sp. DSM 101952]